MAMFIFFCSSAAWPAEQQQAQAQLQQSFDVQIPYAPAAVPFGGEHRLTYELHLTNFAGTSLTVTSIEILDDASGRMLGELTGPELAAALEKVGGPAKAVNRTTIEPGRRGVVYVDITAGGTPPGGLRHRVTFDATGSAGRQRIVLLARSRAVDPTPVPVLGPPLRGGPWVAVYDPHLERGHRRVIYAVGGRAMIPGRHAIDWMRPGHAHATKPTGPGAGAASDEVLAVADGVIAATRDGVLEPAAGSERPRMSLADATGNYVSIDIGGGRYAFYEHLLPGLLVKPGERVTRGQPVGRLGSTGQASRRHLHFHLANANSALAAEGVPYLLAGSRVIGKYASIAAAEAGGEWSREAPSADQAMFPPPNVVITFASDP